MPDAHLLSLEEARTRILEDVLPLRGESLPLPEALGRVLSEDTILGLLLTRLTEGLVLALGGLEIVLGREGDGAVGTPDSSGER